MAPYAATADLPVTDALARTHLALPVGAAMSHDAVDHVVDVVRATVA
jgi:dTDP-4-amino-4,6-dideoxygalactose transaminase